MKSLAQFGKAAFAFALAFGGSIATVLVGNASFGDLTAGQWVAAVLVGLIAGGGVYHIPYVPAKGASGGA